MADPQQGGPSRSKPANPAVPVAINEAAIDSPTFRATSAHFAEQVESIERWLENYARSTSKLVHEVLALEDTINTFISRAVPSTSVAEAVIDQDYTILALRRFADGSREWWAQILSAARRMDAIGVEPVRAFLGNDVRMFKESRKAMEQAQKTFDTTLSRYVSQSKGKEPSALREDAFAVYETRKAYLKASMDFCLLAPQLRFSLDKLLIRVTSDMWRESKRAHDAAITSAKWGAEMDRVRGWSREMEASEAVFKRELQIARRDIGEATLQSFRPSRELEDYSAYTVPFLGSRGPLSVQPKTEASAKWEKQGWLFLRTLSGKPVRTQWIRRWYYCKDGIFGWLVQGPQGVLQGDEIGVLLCNAKPAVQEERRFCFEVKTKNQTILLQTETQTQLSEWLDVFEVAKKHAFEASISRDSSSLPAGIDPAFSITTPSIPEFSAKALDVNIPSEESSLGFERSGTLPIPGADGGLASRASFDVNNSAPRRSITTLTRDESEGGAVRLMQKLELHRKTTFSGGAEASASAAAPAGGIASLISASHTLLPGYATSSVPTTSPPRPPQPSVVPVAQLPLGSLAPQTLAKPPVPTSLSKTAFAVSGERGIGADQYRSMPMAIMANYWGSTVHAATRSVPASGPSGLRDETEQPFKSVIEGSGKRHEAFPLNYPPELKVQSVQFRLLFPNASLDEKLVLVFRAAWTSSSENGATGPTLMGSGRIYVTPDNMYFYGQAMGLVVAYSIPLDEISEVTAAPGKDCDFIFLHLSEDVSGSGFTRVTIKSFLEDLYLLHARLNLLIDDLQAEEPMDVSAILGALINLEREEYVKKSPSLESWEEVSPSTPIDDGTVSGRPAPARGSSSRSYHDKLLRRNLPKFQLPSRPVVYEPGDMQKKVAERHFEISAKACFHVLFGDKSFVFPKLYFERRAQHISQGPWTLTDHGRMRREFHFKVDSIDMLGRSKPADVTDFQTIDVFSEHVTYVVTHVKTPWHLPHSQDFKLVTKVVITHIAKSKCNLAIYTKVDWSKAPAFSKNLVERQAMDDVELDAEELAEVATDQVRKLGPHSRTKRAIQVYGNIGQQTQAVAFTPGEGDATKKQTIKPRTLTTMLFDTIRSFAESVASSLMIWAFAGIKKLFEITTAHRIILLLLGSSILTNLAFTSKESSNWWAERRAASYMNRLGIRPNVMMSKAVYLLDIEQARFTLAPSISGPGGSKW